MAGYHFISMADTALGYVYFIDNTYYIYIYQVFGNVKGERCVLCVDTSDANTGFGRLTAFQESLIVSTNNTNLLSLTC